MIKYDFNITPSPHFSPIPDSLLSETVVHQFERIAARYPDKLAIRSDRCELTYRQLNNSANNLAHLIHETIESSSTTVAFLHSDEILAINILLGILKAGLPSLGLHPGNSREQLIQFLTDSETRLLVTSSQDHDLVATITGSLPDLKVIYYDQIDFQEHHAAPPYHQRSDDIFGLVYTSGSTGEPKGVVVPHQYPAQFLHYMINGWGFSDQERIALLTSVNYHASHPSLFGALLTGSTLYPFDLKNNPAQAALDWIARERLTIFRSTPSIFRSIFNLAPAGMKFPELRIVTLGGEPVQASDVELFKSVTTPDCVLINNYACTEGGPVCHNLVHHNHPPIADRLTAGLPAPGKQVLILDDHRNHVPSGEIGEIVVRSKLLAAGYFNNPSLTDQKFWHDPADPDYRLYATGDLGRILPAGGLEVLGRKDTQVKLRGFRFQLETIDLALRDLPGVLDAGTIVHRHLTAGERLVAYLAMDPEHIDSYYPFKQRLAGKLPDFMIPSVFVRLPALPRTPTGKLSRTDLPEPTSRRPDLTTPYHAPQPGLESQLASIWGNLLDIDPVGINDSFFELGGDSLLALQMTLEVEKLTNTSFPQSFFAQPTISNLIKELGNSDAPAPDRFVLQAYVEEDSPSAPVSRPRWLRTRGSTALLPALALETIFRRMDRNIGRRIARQEFTAARQFMVDWSRSFLSRHLLYLHRKPPFFQWMNEVSPHHPDPRNAFQMALLNNLYSRLPRPRRKMGTFTAVNDDAYLTSEQPFFRSLGELFVNGSTTEILDQFPILGMDHLNTAYQRGKGVILISYHGTPRLGEFNPLLRALGLNEIPVISYLVPSEQSAYRGDHQSTPALAVATMNAEVALYGQQQLRAGRIVSYFSDAEDNTGRTHLVTLGSRQYEMKAGAPEMALNTGAAIVPFTRYCLPDGRIQMEFFPEIDHPIEGNRSDQVDHLIHEYAAFINRTWAEHPDAITWTRLLTHFKQPRK